ncbi:MAG: hypothetical protein KDC45_13480 [Bacteroidetes bacterium]|nr:hypothetical protein [Bacteroidota bacterium]
MELSHLSEEMLQACAEGEQPDEPSAEHLKTCAHCRQQLEVSRMLLRSLQAGPDIHLPVDFSWKVVANIEERTESRKAWREWLMYGALGLCCILITLYYTGSNFTFEMFSSWMADVWRAKSSGEWSARDLNTLFGNGYLYLAYVAFLLWIYDFLDQRFVQKGHRHA